MSDDEGDEEEPAVPLGEGETVEGAPLARIASRLYFPIEASEVRRRDGDTTIRTPDGPRELGSVLDESDEVYFPDRQSLLQSVESVVGTGPVPTASDGGSTTGTEPADEAPPADDNAAEAPRGEREGAPDQDNAAEAAEADDEGGFEFQDAEEGEQADGPDGSEQAHETGADEEADEDAGDTDDESA